MGPLAWSADVVDGLKWWQRVVLALCLCALALPLWFAARNVHRFVDGDRTITEGYVHCDWAGPCTGTWRLPDGQQGRGEIEGLNFAYDEEQVTGIRLYAGRDWAVTDRSDLAFHAAYEFAGAAIGVLVVLSIAWVRSR
ncbi:hypothetical protein JHN63_49465 [Streptomyces sp. MBT65]|uniref:hypothetical protein n=1 Tax=Streptomyces sp. MBT65 TaxID=1488395 RepID=UPI00190A1C01|nr:hypothetical protein [Streptomyces sp. MBT65]MBK3581655.1 hypothetical protein [Streptomyces sp. MBT65]